MESTSGRFTVQSTTRTRVSGGIVPSFYILEPLFVTFFVYDVFMNPCSVFFIISGSDILVFHLWRGQTLRVGFLTNMLLEMRNRAVFSHHIFCKNSTQLCYTKLVNLFDDCVISAFSSFFLTLTSPRNPQSYNLVTLH